MTLQTKARALLCAEYAIDKKALNLKILEIAPVSSLTDFLVVATGTSDRHVQAVAEAIRLGLKDDHGVQPLAVEGMDEGRWVLLDYGDIMVHVFQPTVRSFYDLEGLWSEATELVVPGQDATTEVPTR